MTAAIRGLTVRYIAWVLYIQQSRRPTLLLRLLLTNRALRRSCTAAAKRLISMFVQKSEYAGDPSIVRLQIVSLIETVLFRTVGLSNPGARRMFDACS